MFDNHFFSEPDIEITFFNKGNVLADDCSFCNDGSTPSDKYDFVTLVMRDLAKALGFYWRYHTVQNGSVVIQKDNMIPFEEAIGGGTDGKSLYKKATQGELLIDEGLKLYAPPVWDPNRSLQYFIPDSTIKITQLLSYDFGRGTVVHDINDFNTRNLFHTLLTWDGDNTVDGSTPVDM